MPVAALFTRLLKAAAVAVPAKFRLRPAWAAAVAAPAKFRLRPVSAVAVAVRVKYRLRKRASMPLRMLRLLWTEFRVEPEPERTRLWLRVMTTDC